MKSIPALVVVLALVALALHARWRCNTLQQELRSSYEKRAHELIDHAGELGRAKQESAWWQQERDLWRRQAWVQAALAWNSNPAMPHDGWTNFWPGLTPSMGPATPDRP